VLFPPYIFLIPFARHLTQEQSHDYDLWIGGMVGRPQGRQGRHFDQERRAQGLSLGFASRFEGKPGTNPEELIGGAHAGCFTMALSLILSEAKLTAEKMDFDRDLRWMGYYPGVTQRSEATVIEIKAGDKLRDLNFKVRQESVYTVSFQIVASDGTPLPLEAFGIMIDSNYRDALSYHLNQHVRDGWFTMGYVPPGHYVVQTYLEYGVSEKVRKELSKWRMAKQEVEIKADADIVLKLEPAN